MKRLICMMLAALMLLTAAAFAEAAGEPLTMRRVMEANEAGTLMEQYESIHILVKSGKEMWERYMGPEGYYYNDGQNSELYCGSLHYAGENGKFSATVYAGVEIDLSAFDRIFFGEDYIDMEEILYQSEADGVMLLKTQLHLSDVNPGLIDPGNYLVVEYALDAETLAVLDLREKLRFDNGQSVWTDAEFTITYGAEPPEVMKEMLDRLSQENACTVTVTLNPGSDEGVVSAAVAKGDRVEIVVPEGYALYSDTEMKKKWKSGSIKADTSVYAVPGK